MHKKVEKAYLEPLRLEKNYLEQMLWEQKLLG